MKHDENKLNVLLRRFVDEAPAEAMAEDIQKGDTLLEQFTDPVLSDEAKGRLCARVEAACAARSRHRRITVGFAGVAAASVALFVVLFIGNDLAPSPVSPPNGGVEIARVEPIVPAPVQPESQPVAKTPEEVSGQGLGAVAQYLWDEVFHTDSQDSFTAIRDELDSIAAAIEAVRRESAGAVRHRFLNGTSGDDGDQRDRPLITPDFWKG